MLLASAPLSAPGPGPPSAAWWWTTKKATPVMGAEVLVQSTPLRALTGDDGRFESPCRTAAPTRSSSSPMATAARRSRPTPPAPQSAPLRVSLEPQLFDVPGVTVTASRSTVRPGQAPVSIAILSGEELRRRDVTNLSEALPFAPGRDLQRGPHGYPRLQRHRPRRRQPGPDAAGRTPGAHGRGIADRLQHPAASRRGPHRDREGPQLDPVGHETPWPASVNVITPPAPGAPAHRRARLLRRVRTPRATWDFTDERLSMRGLQIQHARQIGDAGVTVFAGREGSDGFRQNGGQERWQWRAKAVFGAESSKPLEVFASGKREDLEEFFTWLSPERRLECGSRGPGRLEAQFRSRLRDDGHSGRDLDVQAAASAPGAARPQPELLPRQRGTITVPRATAPTCSCRSSPAYGTRSRPEEKPLEPT